MIPHRLAWARSFLKKAGLLDSGGRGIWILTDAGRQAVNWPEDKLKKYVKDKLRAETKAKKERKPEKEIAAQSDESNQREEIAARFDETDRGEKIATRFDDTDQIEDEADDWKAKLLHELKAMDPSAFERLARRILLESGFIKVDVTGRPRDGGIDGTGVLQISLMSFHILFQCKRYQGSVGAGAIRDFRGAMAGRTDKGLVITTGTFSPDARREATRDGASLIDLIDGDDLCEKLKELRLGVKTEMVEEVTIESDWFDKI